MSIVDNVVYFGVSSAHVGKNKRNETLFCRATQILLKKWRKVQRDRNWMGRKADDKSTWLIRDTHGEHALRGLGFGGAVPVFFSWLLLSYTSIYI